MEKATEEIANEVQLFLNKSFDLFAKRFLNIDEHRFHIKQEVIAKSGLWIAKKRYVLWIINENGIQVNKIDVKGIDSVRSNFPKAFRKFLKQSLEDILKNATKVDIDEKVLSFKKNLLQLGIDEVAKPTSVKGIGKYTKHSTNVMLGKTKSPFGNAIKGTPAHVKAAINYNNFLKYMGLDKQYVPLVESDKIKWAYLKQNPLGLEEIAFRGYDDPPEVTKFVEQYIDANKIFERELWSKLMDLYSAMKWSQPSESEKNLSKFFQF
jgi:hypothetical protein